VGVPDPAQPEPRLGHDAVLAVLTVMRKMAALALAVGEVADGDEDLLTELTDGLRALPAVARVRRVTLTAGERAHESTADDPHDALRTLRQAEISPTNPLIAPVAERSPHGRVLSLSTPLVSRAGDIEVFVAEAHPQFGAGLSARECALAETLRDQAAVALALRAARAEARLDALTGCLNHGAMHAQLADEIARTRRFSRGLACVMLDLDDFKTVNDRFGHPAGDRVLRAVATAMARECREYDVCCRYGGDEFLVILPDAGIEEALHSAERLRAAVEASVVDYEGTAISVGATAGATSWRADEPPAALLARVDRALMSAKAAGRGGTGHA
jgi:diguanylate cyclase (GGDEF)-like protein